MHSFKYSFRLRYCEMRFAPVLSPSSNESTTHTIKPRTHNLIKLFPPPSYLCFEHKRGQFEASSLEIGCANWSHACFDGSYIQENIFCTPTLLTFESHVPIQSESEKVLCKTGFTRCALIPDKLKRSLKVCAGHKLDPPERQRHLNSVPLPQTMGTSTGCIAKSFSHNILTCLMLLRDNTRFRQDKNRCDLLVGGPFSLLLAMAILQWRFQDVVFT